MKVVAAPIQMIVWFDTNGTPNPIRFKYNSSVIKINKVVSVVLEKLAGNNTYVFTCRAEVGGEEKMLEIKYELRTCRWMLFKV